MESGADREAQEGPREQHGHEEVPPLRADIRGTAPAEHDHIGRECAVLLAQILPFLYVGNEARREDMRPALRERGRP